MESNTKRNIFPVGELDQKMTLLLNEFTLLMNKNDLSTISCEKIPGIDQGYILYNSLNEEECNFLRQNLEYNENVEFKTTDKKVYRKNLRLQISHSLLAEIFFEC